jgi:hypothetical protein
VNALEQADEAIALAKDAFAAGDMVTGIAALQLAAQLTQIARTFEIIVKAEGK